MILFKSTVFLLKKSGTCLLIGLQAYPDTIHICLFKVISNLYTKDHVLTCLRCNFLGFLSSNHMKSINLDMSYMEDCIHFMISSWIKLQFIGK